MAKNKISKKINNFLELGENLNLDLEDPLKKENQISNSINNLGRKTLTDTIKNINNFLINEIK